MKCVVVILASLLILAKHSLAESCNTCRGVACAAKTLPQKSCDDYVSPLPFESLLMFNEVDETAKYGCLNLQYYISKSLEVVQQCVLSNDLDSYCSMLESALKVKSCSVEATLEERVERSADALDSKPSVRENEEEDAEEDGDTTDATDPDDSTDGAELLRTISLSCLAVVLFTVLY